MRELRAWRDDPQRQQSEDDPRLAAVGRKNQIVEADFAYRAQHDRDMAVRKTASDLEVAAAGIQRLIRFEATTNQLDQVFGEIAERTQRQLLDLAVLSIGVTQQLRHIGFTLVSTSNRRHVNRAYGLAHAAVYCKFVLLSTIVKMPNKTLKFSHVGNPMIVVKTAKKSGLAGVVRRIAAVELDGEGQGDNLLAAVNRSV